MREFTTITIYGGCLAIAFSRAITGIVSVTIAIFILEFHYFWTVTMCKGNLLFGAGAL